MENKIHSAMKKAKYEKPKRVQVIALLEENLKKELFIKLEKNGFTFTEFLESSVILFLKDGE